MENKITSSENSLRLIDPSAKIKSTATFKALENFINGEIIKINFTENRKHSKRNILNIELKIKPKNRCRNVR